MKLKAFIITAAAILLSPGAASAYGLGQAAALTSANDQDNNATIIQNPSGGTQVNNNVNNAYSSTYEFGHGIACPTSSIAVNAFTGGSDASSGGYSSSGSAFGGSVSLITPIGGSVGNSCRELAEEVTRQRQLDTQVTLIRVCADLHRSKVVVDYQTFPELEVCSAVSVVD